MLLGRCNEGKLILTTYLDGCLAGFPLPEWEEFEQACGAIRNSSRQLRDFRRLVIGGAEEVSLDNQGRIRLSPDHRSYAGLSNEIILVGQLSRFEVWAPARHDSIYTQNFDQVTEELSKSGINIFI